MNQAELAVSLGVTRQTIVRWESGEGGATFENIAKLADVLKVEETDLLASHSPRRPIKDVITVRECTQAIEEALLIRAKTLLNEELKNQAFLQNPYKTPVFISQRQDEGE